MHKWASNASKNEENLKNFLSVVLQISSSFTLLTSKNDFFQCHTFLVNGT